MKCRPVDVQQPFQLLAWIPKNDKVLPLDHAFVARAEGDDEFAKMGRSCIRAFVAFVRVNCLSIIANESLVA